MVILIRKYIMAIVVILITTTNVYAYEAKYSPILEAELRMLDSYKDKYGLGSVLFNDKLIKTFVTYQDIDYLAYYSKFAKLFIESRNDVKANFGVDSEQFKSNTNALFCIFSANCAKTCISQEENTIIIQELKNLERILTEAPNNRHKFLNILSHTYTCLGDYNKAISFARICVDEANNNSNKLAEAYNSLLDALGRTGKTKDFTDVVNKAVALKGVDKEIYSNMIFTAMFTIPLNASAETWRLCFREYIRAGHTLNPWPPPLFELACGLYNHIFDLIDSEFFPQIPLEERYPFYRTLGALIKEQEGELELGIKYKRKAIELAEKASRPDLLYWQIGSVVRNEWLVLACFYQETPDFISELDAFSHAVKAFAKYPGKNTKSYLEARELATRSCQNRLNSYHSDPKEFQRVIFNLEDSFDQGLCADSVIRGIVYKCIGDYFGSIKDYINADDYYFKASELLKSLDVTDDILLSLLNNIGDNLSMIKQYDRAIRFQNLVCEIRENSLGATHWKTLLSKNNLISYLISNGDIEKADSVFHTIQRNEDLITVPEDRYDYFMTQALLCNSKQDWKSALYAIDQAEKFALTHMQQRRLNEERAKTYKEQGDTEAYYNWLLSEIDNLRDDLISDNLRMSREERKNAQFYIQNLRDWLIKEALSDPRLITSVSSFCLFSKGLLFHTDTMIKLSLAKNKKSLAVSMQIKEILRKLNYRYTVGDSLSISALKRQLRIVEKELVSEYLPYAKLSNLLKNTAYIDTRLTANDLAIDFVSFSSDDSTHYGAFIYDPLSKMPGFVTIDGSNVWKSLRTYLNKKNRIYFSTDGILNTLPIEFAEDENGVPMCEKYDLHRVFHLSDIRPEIGIGKRVEAIGVADHNSPAGKACRLDDGYRGNWSDLAGVETELFCIAENLDGASDYHRAFNDDATEQYVKSLSGQPITTLHIATHGFYRSEEEIIKAYDNPSDFDHNIAQRFLLGNRTSVSGLVMRNGNLSWKAEAITDDEDNILTSDEVESLSFPTLNLTVLSACETGLGDISADGVWGLQRAFRIAGTSSLICSLYKVKDNGTADFMSEFYHHAASGLSVHEAFYKARKELLKRDPAKKEAWSSFILIE